MRSAETLYVAGTTAVCHTESGSQHSFYRIEVEQLTDDEGSDHRTDDSRHDDDDIRWVCEDLRVVCEVRTDTNGNHQWEGHILYEELLHAPCAGLHVFRQDIRHIQNRHQDDHESEGMNTEAEVCMVDDGDVLCVEVSYIEAYDTECETGCVVGCGQLHVTGLRADIFFTDHETTITRHGWLDLAELVQQCRHEDGAEIANADDCKGRCIPGGGITAGCSSPHLAHRCDTGTIATAHDWNCIGGDRLDCADASDGTYETSEAECTCNTCKNRRNESGEGFDEHLTINREHRAGDQDENVEIEETGGAVEGIQGFHRAFTDQVEGVHRAGYEAGEEHAAAEPGLPDRDMVTDPAEQRADDHREGECADHVGQHPVIGCHHHHQYTEYKVHPQREPKDLRFF